jgi:hypothetical protein
MLRGGKRNTDERLQCSRFLSGPKSAIKWSAYPTDIFPGFKSFSIIPDTNCYCFFIPMPAEARHNQTSPQTSGPQSERLRARNCEYQKRHRRKVREQQKQHAAEKKLLLARLESMNHHPSSVSMSDRAPSLTAAPIPDLSASYYAIPQPGESFCLARAYFMSEESNVDLKSPGRLNGG